MIFPLGRQTLDEKNGFAKICSLRIRRRNVKLRSKYAAEMVKATFAYLKPGAVNNLANVAFTVLVQVYSPDFTILRHICREQIYANPDSQRYFSASIICSFISLWISYHPPRAALLLVETITSNLSSTFTITSYSIVLLLYLNSDHVNFFSEIPLSRVMTSVLS